MAIKSKELAKILGVSPATLSFVLNNKGSISQKSRDNIKSKIVQLGYGYMLNEEAPQTGAAERGVISLRSDEQMGSIGFVIYKDTGRFIDKTTFFPQLFAGMETIAKRNDYGFLVLAIDKSMTWEEKEKRIMESGCVGLVVYAPELQAEDVGSFQELGLPFVLLDNYFPGKAVDSITLDNEQGIYVLLERLKENGHRKVMYLSSGVDIQSFRERRASFLQHAGSLGMTAESTDMITVGYPETEAQEGVRRFLENDGELPTAFVAEDDCVAYGAIAALKAAGYQVPQDVSVTGFADMPLCLYCSPNITTVRIPCGPFGGAAVERLMDILRRRADDTRGIIHTNIYVQLIERGSIGAARTSAEQIAAEEYAG